MSWASKRRGSLPRSPSGLFILEKNLTIARAQRAVLVAGHAPFCWGISPADAAHNAVILESVAKMAYHTIGIAAEADPISRHLHDKHFLRKHGHSAYYGQVPKK